MYTRKKDKCIQEKKINVYKKKDKCIQEKR